MNLAIIFALGVLVGAIFTGIVFRLFLVGTLRVDHSDPDGPFLFLELSKRVEAIVSKKYVVMRVKANRGSFSLLDKLSCAIRKRLFRLSRNM